jgi:hypothetical protein
MTTDSFIYLRHTVSKVTSVFTAEEAAHVLANPWFKQFYEQVDSPKDEVLAPPYKLNEDGERVTLVQEKPLAADQPAADPTPDKDATK